MALLPDDAGRTTEDGVRYGVPILEPRGEPGPGRSQMQIVKCQSPVTRTLHLEYDWRSRSILHMIRESMPHMLEKQSWFLRSAPPASCLGAPLHPSTPCSCQDLNVSGTRRPWCRRSLILAAKVFKLITVLSPDRRPRHSFLPFYLWALPASFAFKTPPPSPHHQIPVRDRPSGEARPFQDERKLCSWWISTDFTIPCSKSTASSGAIAKGGLERSPAIEMLRRFEQPNWYSAGGGCCC